MPRRTSSVKPPPFSDMRITEVNCTTGEQTTRDATAAERKAKQRAWLSSLPGRVEERRATRNRLLAGSDWTQLPDAPLTDKQRGVWAEYRQALRDMEFGDDPDAIVFPKEPT